MEDTKFPNGKEVFGTVAKNYAQFRPRYPSELFSFLSSLTRQHDLVWDVGTGNSQTATELSRYYVRVVGIDTSEKKIQHAEPRPNVTYAVTPPSMSDEQLQSIVGPESFVDLVTVTTALHWFDLERFYPQLKSVLNKPSGVIAVWGYWHVSVDEAVDTFYERFFQRKYSFYHPATKAVVEEYQNLAFPFEKVEVKKMAIEEERSCEEYLGYFQTWSGLAGREEILEEEFRADFEAAWGAELHVTKPAKFPIFAKVEGLKKRKSFY